MEGTRNNGPCLIWGGANVMMTSIARGTRPIPTVVVVVVLLPDDVEEVLLLEPLLLELPELPLELVPLLVDPELVDSVGCGATAAPLSHIGYQIMPSKYRN